MSVAVKKKKPKERMGFGMWCRTYCRPLLTITYVAICIFDFIIGPILFNVLEYWNPGQAISAYQAITLQGGGILHLSYGAIIGIHTHGRTKEKLAELKPSSPEE